MGVGVCVCGRGGNSSTCGDVIEGHMHTDIDITGTTERQLKNCRSCC